MSIRLTVQLLLSPVKTKMTATLMMMMMMMKMVDAAAAASHQTFCSNTSSEVLRTRSACHACSVTVLMKCPAGYQLTPGSTAQDCQYQVRSARITMSIHGCSFECYKEAELKRCCPGFWGPDCIECPERADQPCSNRGVCSDGLGGNGTCSCQIGFAGTACEDCDAGRYGNTCSSVCSCVHGLCNGGLRGDGSCTCFSGYTGPNCDQELPACASLGCKPNSRCLEEALTGRLVCQCLPGYSKSGDECLSINPCVQPVCHAHATCVHSGPNQHLCACDEGYHGDGRICIAIDPCQTDHGGCSVKTTRCVYDGPGKSYCECLPGSERVSDSACNLMDACRPGSCHKNANCITVAPGQVECSCYHGYIGNGKFCYGNIMQRLRDLNTEPGSVWTGRLTRAITLFGSLSWPLQDLGPFTLFVPSNSAFRGMPVKTLMANQSKARYLCKMHLVAGVMPFDTLKKSGIFYTLTGKSGEIDVSEGDRNANLRIHGSRKRGLILEKDLLASNGMIHIINKLMDSVAATVESDAEENLMKIISDYGKFEKFKYLLEKANMASLMDLGGPLTVFAPVGAAFDAMAEGQLEYLSSASGANKLVELLRHHIVPSTSLEVYNAVSSSRIMTMANQALTINRTENGQLLVNGAAVLEAAVEAKNGRLYVLDAVLMPPSIEPVLPHRCDITDSRIIKDKCVSCSKVKLSCSSGVYTDSSVFGCLYTISVGLAAVSLPATGCWPLCNITVTTPACCKGFYGPDCRACPGGYQTPCSGHGQCLDGMEGNGSCVCQSNFRGSRCQYCLSANKYGPKCDRTCPCIHGQCDNRPDSDGRCKVDSCRPGFTGRLCERSTAACGAQAQFCHAHADCDFSQGTARCVCKPGYQGDGITCVESDPCAPPLRGGCSINAKCIKTGPGRHTCQCLAGWQQDGDECRSINNCQSPERGGCHPNATCIYVGPGQSDCTCKSGYKGDGHDCEAVNECVTESGGCHYLATCRLLSSQWTCVCDDGYVGNGQICFGSVRQELMVLPEAAEFLTWTTESGLSRSLSEQNITLLLPSSAAVQKMTAEDRKFWSTKGNLQSLVRNHMIAGVLLLSSLSKMASVTSLLKTSLPVSTTSELTAVGGATVTMADITATNGVIHLIDQVLVPDRKLSEGLLATLQLQAEFALFRSYLIEYNLTDEIEQAEDFTVFAPTDTAINNFLKKTAATALDVNTTRYHVVASERLLKTDLQAGGYKQTMLGFNFQLGFFSREGKLFVNDVPVNVSNILSGRGVIHGVSDVLHIIKNRCDEVKYQKVVGACVDCLFPRSKICPNDTVPDKSVKRKKCMFSRMFEGERLLTIGCKATCLQTSIMPRCCTGFFGPQCESCPGPKGQPCFGNGFCLDGTNGTGLCRCNKGFDGTACQRCQSGKYGVHCDQDCGCVNGRCDDGLEGDGTCKCDVGWRGILCDEKIESRADEVCGSVKCHTSANCVIQQSQPQCLCAAGFHGNGTFCQAKDACELDNGGCSHFAVCKRTRPGQRDCVCRSGFTGDGLICIEINPCLEGNGGCHANAECVHTGPNKTSCSCRGGFSGDGQSCKMINLCQKKNGGCHEYARCNMTGPGTRSCVCRSSYVGDGLTCRGTVGKEILTHRLRDFYLSLMMVEISLKGRGPFTVFAPNSNAFATDRNNGSRMKSLMSDKCREQLATVLRGHIVMCHTLLPSDLLQPRNMTSLSGLVLTTGSSQANILVNQVNVTYSDGIGINGIFHEVNRILFPPNMDMKIVEDVTPNLTDVVRHHGYGSFYKLLQDTGVINLMHDGMYQPVTIFLPSDTVMSTLPQEQKDFLYHQHNRAQLLEYLKYHILLNHKIYAEGLIHLDSARTLQGSPLSFSCGGTDAIGEIYVNDGKCRITQRHLVFNGGIAYGIDCLLTPPSLGGRCDSQTTFDLQMSCGLCTSSARCPRGSKLKEVQRCDLPTMFISKNAGCRSVCTVNFWQPKCCHGYYGRDCQVCPGGVGSACSNRGKCDDGHLGNGTCACVAGFEGMACERCSEEFYGPSCKACNCSEHGSCVDGHKGTGSCLCEAGWTGKLCETPQAEVFQCFPSCAQKAVCQENNTCICQPLYEGDGFTCTVIDLCQIWNGGCAKVAKCSQRGERVTCTCPKGHTGDGFTCQPIDPCAAGDNGGCNEHGICTVTAPGKRKCTCKDGYIGDGVTCELKQLPISRCLQENGLCHQDAQCTDLHFEDVTLGVFHLRSEKGQYKLNYTAAQQACSAVGGRLGSYVQLSYAQQGGLNMCAAGWLDEARVAYPTTYSNPNCGFGHVGIVDYGVRKNLSETWDTFCYRMKEVKCECKAGYIGDGLSCTGNLLQVLMATPTFSNFLTQVLNVSQRSESGERFLRRLSDPLVQATLFVPDNSGLLENQTLTQRDLEFHLSEGQALPLSQLTNGSRIRTRVGTLAVRGVGNLLEPSALTSRYINNRFVTSSDILASNGMIHVLQGPLQAPPPYHELHVTHKAGLGVGMLLLVLLVAGIIFVGYHFYTHNSKPFQFHYFKDDGEAESWPVVPGGRSISNPVYEAASEPAVSTTSNVPEDKQQLADNGVCELLQDPQVSALL